MSSSVAPARCIRLKHSPLLGNPLITDFLFDDIQPPLIITDQSSISLESGQLLIKPLYISVDPYLRGRFYGGPDGYSSKEIIHSPQIAQILKANSLKYKTGDILMGNFPWSTFAIIEDSNKVSKTQASKCRIYRQILNKTNCHLSYHLGILGTTGMTAYQGLFDVGKIKKNEQVFISGAAGAVGSAVGQIAKHVMDCHVVGTAGTSEKIEWLVEHLGFDAGIHYKSFNDENRDKNIREFRRELRRKMPNGIDLYFDNTGGFVTEAVWKLLNYGARVVVCGQISNYNQLQNIPKINDFLSLLIYNHIRIEGFSIFSFKRYAQFISDMNEWIDEGLIESKETVYHGFESIPHAFLGLFSGTNTGKMIVQIDDNVNYKKVLHSKL